VKRAPALRELSRQHHQALVLARSLRAIGAAPNVVDEIVRMQALARTHLTPHFLVEERELLPLSHGQGPDLAAHASTVRRDHVELQEQFAKLSIENVATRAQTLADRLEAHVRFEERTWFPALEAVLDDDTIESLTWRLDPEPRVPIVGFRHDDGEAEGVWVAALACGHPQHVRHRPPFQDAAWVLSEEGRAQKLGTRLNCVLCRMPRLPPRAVIYKETPVFDVHTVPNGLLARHTLGTGTWGKIVVLEGRVDYVIENDPPLSFVLRPGVDGGVAPGQPHHVTLQPGARFQVCFLR
jgi:tellurite methyltransferase